MSVSFPTSNASSSTNVDPTPSSFEIPPFLQTASKVVKIVAAIVFAIGGVGSLAIAITMIPFNPTVSGGAFAASAALFAASGGLFYSAFSK